MTQRIVLATGNAGKLKEIREIFSVVDVDIVAQSEFDTPEAIEDGLSFVENAIIKARNAAAHTGLPALSDDSGIEVDALDGEPGIHSARYAGDDESNIQRLLRELDGIAKEKRIARFQCVMVYIRHANDPVPVIAHGVWEGRILSATQGQGGFGYDPVFYVPERDCSAAELTAEDKNVLSHRGKALRQMLELFTTNYNN
ncbi:MAG TPA: RdgB/HAM1 family non-canonical purine NTP pyrophosphatase [Gammaproteobacteria bacterium]|nr:dITP/XTP pyrophosphatase [bacterium BMS3Abin11]GMT40201.1 MAG: non-canonical purine NTP pyrophosphatase [bacterium]HDH16987.1 RdgB/HAM1 family non-canonical purine NTP pyrophosphatase [Gammaproteobacteria bacterium]HDZ77925.1 RdgB/HAM1 family non-canonical purine NTP pyrophosphatase [Gammaproteobacteria bacterium]